MTESGEPKTTDYTLRQRIISVLVIFFLAAALAYIAVKLTLLALELSDLSLGTSEGACSTRGGSIRSPRRSLRRSALGLYTVAQEVEDRPFPDDPGRVGGKTSRVPGQNGCG